MLATWFFRVFFQGFSGWEHSGSRSVVSDSLPPRGLYSPWNSPGQSTGVSSLSLLQGIFPTQVPHIAGRFFTSWATREAIVSSPQIMAQLILHRRWVISTFSPSPWSTPRKQVLLPALPLDSTHLQAYLLTYQMHFRPSSHQAIPTPLAFRKQPSMSPIILLPLPSSIPLATSWFH